MAIKVFVAANLPDAVMEVKVNVDDELSRDGMSVTGHKEIRFIKADWPAMQVANWLRGGDVMLYLSSGEGFGLMPLEAMATGLPVICAYNSGMMDYLTPQNALLVQCPSLAPVPSFNYFREPAPPVFFGYQPDFDEAVAHLRWAYANREAAYAIGRQAAVDTHHWTWQRAGAKALAALETFAGG
jgi:glycosyltransferase involved in cell wall biosynthesis